MNIRNNFVFFIAANEVDFIRDFYWSILFFLKNVRYELDNYSKDTILISSEKGIIKADLRGKCKKLTYGYTFGIARFKKRIYLSISSSNKSKILGIDFNNEWKVRTSILFTQASKYHNERIHQIFATSRCLYIANTARNSLVIIKGIREGESSKIIELFPFSDFLGNPICNDHNHINSIYPINKGILFCAHNRGKKGSYVGLIEKSICKIYKYKNPGIHDIIPTSKGIIISDSFGNLELNNKNHKSGGIYLNGQFQSTDCHFSRGVYLGSNLNIIGSSFHAKRDERFFGKGQIKIYDKKFKEVKKINCISSQIHDMIGITGSRNEEKLDSIKLNIKNIENDLNKSFGSKIYQNKFTKIESPKKL